MEVHTFVFNFVRSIFCTVAGAFLGGILGAVMYFVVDLATTPMADWAEPRPFYALFVFVPVNLFLGSLVGAIVGLIDLKPLGGIIAGIGVFIAGTVPAILFVTGTERWYEGLYVLYAYFFLAFFPAVLTGLFLATGKMLVFKAFDAFRTIQP